MSIGVVWAVGSTNKSKSLSGVSSPCAGESNTRTSLTRDLADLPAVQREDFGETHPPRQNSCRPHFPADDPQRNDKNKCRN